MRVKTASDSAGVAGAIAVAATAKPSSVRRPLRVSSGGRITGSWVRAVKLPPARGLSRGYDRKAVDAFLLECANGVDWLGGLLIGAENELGRLAAQAPAPETIRPIGRAAASLGQAKPRKKQAGRPRIRSAGRPAVSRP